MNVPLSVRLNDFESMSCLAKFKLFVISAKAEISRCRRGRSIDVSQSHGVGGGASAFGSSRFPPSRE